MQIFILDLDTKKCAEYHCDFHVISGIKELAQMLSTCHYHTAGKTYDKSLGMLAPTHTNHPCNVWLRESLGNYYWATNLFAHLNEDFEKRYNHEHIYKKLVDVFLAITPILPVFDSTPFKIAFSDNLGISPYINTDEDAVRIYREYYIQVKSKLAKWRYTEKPFWYPDSAFENLIVDKDHAYARYLVDEIQSKDGKL